MGCAAIWFAVIGNADFAVCDRYGKVATSSNKCHIRKRHRGGISSALGRMEVPPGLAKTAGTWALYRGLPLAGTSKI